MSQRLRLLTYVGADPAAHGAGPPWADAVDATTTGSLAEALAKLDAGGFDAIAAPLGAPDLADRVRIALRTALSLEAADDGVAVLVDLRIVWANRTFAEWCPASPVGRVFYEALGAPTLVGPNHAPLELALQGAPSQCEMALRCGRHIEFHVTPHRDADGAVRQLLILGRDVTVQANQQAILEKLHQTANQMGALDVKRLTELDVNERVELLKINIRRLTHDLLHYDVIEIRLLDAQTGRLTPLLSEAMLPEAAKRSLVASVDGNGVTGYVAATGKSYVCRDASSDPRYLEGSQGARSSLTVPIKWNNEIIGTFNVESPQLDGFTAQDLQFAEIFCREVASALHTLDLLVVEKREAANQMIEAVSREVALPVDDILAAATSMLDRWIGHEPEMEEKLRLILERARAVKRSIQQVGEDLAPARPLIHSNPENAQRLKGKRILVADNEDRLRRSAHSLLGRLGAIVETAKDGREAVTMARLSPYDTILADIRLPDLSGYEIFRQLRQAQPDAHVVLMTGFGWDPSHAIVKARQEGLTHVLYKPFKVDLLIAAIERRDPLRPVVTAAPPPPPPPRRDGPRA